MVAIILVVGIILLLFQAVAASAGFFLKLLVALVVGVILLVFLAGVLVNKTRRGP